MGSQLLQSHTLVTTGSHAGRAFDSKDLMVFFRFLVAMTPALVGCAGSNQGGGDQQGLAGSSVSSPVNMQSVAGAQPRGDSSGPGAAAQVTPQASEQTPMRMGTSAPAMGSAGQSMPVGTSITPVESMVGAPPQNAMDAGQTNNDQVPRNKVDNLSDKALAMWGSSVCDGFSVPSGAAWPWTVEKRLAEISGPKVLHVSTSGHNTNNKESSLERSKVESADFVVVCLSLGNQGLGSATTEASAQTVVDSYLDDIFTDDSDTDGDPVSMVNFIRSLGAHPIVTLVYPMAEYSTLHCQHVVKANILQQTYGVATINHLGSTNAGNDFGEGDCTWANGRNAPINVQSDARHPNSLGHDEMFYAFPPDLPFALASEIPFPQRPQTTDYMSLSQATGASSAPIRYTPEHAIHSYTMQFAFQAISDGTLAAIELGLTGFLTIELKDGAVHLVTEDRADALQGSTQVANNDWHDVAITYSYVRQKLALYVDGALVGEHDAREGNAVRELFPRSFILGGPAASGQAAAPSALQLRDLFINRSPLHAMEIAERAKTDWVGAGSLDVYAPLRTTAPSENRAQTLQVVQLGP